MPETAPGLIIRRQEPARLERAHGLDLGMLHPWGDLTTPFHGAWCVLRPGDVTEVHQHTERELFICMAGRAEVRSADGSHPIAAGDLVLLPVDSDHSVANPHDEDFAYYAIWWEV
ncbi:MULTISPECIES: cupin domain-containing protein [unclassified Kitasatospora]|uniref:cupin domain-containing protein n=1 Tax=unclassified Kitasatospora TaxID=2633591 RepID=UPI00070D2209|nr:MULTISPECIES: cupin domain-containing protein [unclassified Kitasatospora]KQV17158.1 gentisate 1,2-dioxygenase [Kitasatospora sp. Root107]KRB69995.1 gentisate 1,2-dioxygenase [Kitasatospora sp. Root187]